MEIVVVMVIIAGASVIAVMTLGGGYERLQIQSSVKEIAVAVKHARATALATSKPQKFIIDPEAHTWQIEGGKSGTIPDSLTVSFTGARALQSHQGQGAILFFEDGASTGGRVQLKSKRAVWNVDVAWLTGQVLLYRGESAE